MFVLASKHLFWWPVVAMVPSPVAPGTFDRQEFRVHMEALPEDELKAIDAAFADYATAKERADHQHDLLYRVVHDWEDVVSEDKAPVAFDAATMRGAMQMTWFRNALYAAYHDALSGGARLGN
ncbi:MAG: hypothetical protein B7Y12_02185 [Rhizobiales bacterium 24-66-13]|jgi:hypothetical protein|nr:MAG: hypothetical protein B7Z41_03105 [Rhizobiales bacterium 12-66-7]OYY88830.1 MAG: hypothetical protein B7Y61_01215 [Rhizobiales bacterium 35-66-30]OYZ82824.1 MAG: hypothetical protein B7Y12_02185 [Rhizobiales bacterium 24-66-13]OZB11857.1 MAG: hypothetical protein B7X67_02165 [Rhizobiales bacterium 39-66-18]HQS08718.1 hypothetical protein [Xanthobacteraceae bacterium]